MPNYSNVPEKGSTLNYSPQLINGRKFLVHHTHKSNLEKSPSIFHFPTTSFSKSTFRRQKIEFSSGKKKSWT